MNKLIIIYIACIIIVLANAANKKIPKKSVHLINHAGLNDQWSDFKLKYNKKYINLIEETRRKNIFNESITKINEYNKNYNDGNISHISGINKFSDWTFKEFMNYVNKDSLKISENYTSKNEIKYKKKQSNKLSIKSIDWRRKGVVNPIKDQDKCGSCWAFTSVSAIESHVAINYGILLNLSEQNLVDCATGKDGCDGASVFDAFDYIKSNGGIDTQDSYPYVSGSTRRWSGRCEYRQGTDSGVQVAGYVRLPPDDEQALQEAISNIGPVTVAFAASEKFKHYYSGVFTDTTCTDDINHGGLLVGQGYDRDSDKYYYIMRNSWGTDHGINGYCLFERNNDNMCRIASEASYPIVKFTTNSNHPDSNSDKQEDNFEWQSGDRCIWAYSCHFRGNTIAKVYQPNTGAHCSGKCADTDGCTHFYWNGHTEYCWLKSGSVSKSDAISNDSDNLVVCGIITND